MAAAVTVVMVVGVQAVVVLVQQRQRQRHRPLKKTRGFLMRNLAKWRQNTRARGLFCGARPTTFASITFFLGTPF
jgi:hypothetical protein